MQLFVWEAMNMAYFLITVSHKQRQLVMSKIVSKLHNTHVLETRLAK